MSNLIIKRRWMDSRPTIGDVSFEGKSICHTVEKPWKNNERRVSCIPAGIYEFAYLPNGSKKFPYPCFLLKNVDGRSAIMMHRANKESELLGCIAPNLEVLSDNTGKHSTAALQKIVDLYLKYKFTHIEIQAP